MLERRYIKDLERWLDSPDRKPLIIWGARQCGKTFLVRDIFSKRHFDGNTIYVDCRTEAEFCDYCENHPNVDDVIRYLSLRFRKSINGSTLIVFDEVQECPSVITLLKYFCQDHREIPVITTGSMVRIKLKRKKRGRGEKGFLFPVGKINEITIHPLSFDEYLYNRNRMMYDAVVEAYRAKESLDDGIHRMAMDILYEYLMIGGMPEAVDTFLRTDDLNMTRKVLKELYNNYLSDMDLYQASPESILRSRAIFSNIFPLLNRKSKNFSPSFIEKGTRKRDMISPLDWLSEAHVINISRTLPPHVTVPFISDGNMYRIYLADMGMFSYQSDVEPVTFLSDNGRNTLSGVFFENYAAEELASRGIELYNWEGKDSAEFEFILHRYGDIIPMDVKKGKGKLNSLTRFKEHNSCAMAVKVSRNNYGFDEKTSILTLPLYQLFMFAREIADPDIGAISNL